MENTYLYFNDSNIHTDMYLQANPIVSTNVSNVSSLELMYLINNINNTIEINSLLIKDKIKRKLDIIKNLIICGFNVINYDTLTSKNILAKLNEIDNANSNANSNSSIDKYNYINTVVYKEELNNILGKILHNIYEYSGYQVLLSNTPQYGEIWEDNKHKKIDCETIYDTMVNYGGENSSVISVLQVSSGSYLIKFLDDVSAMEICNTLNNTMIGINIIKVEYVKKLNTYASISANTNIENVDSTIFKNLYNYMNIINIVIKKYIARICHYINN